MSIQDLGSLGELIAAIATVVTLAYLAVQIRQSTYATRAASFQSVTDSINFVNMSVTQNSELSRIYVAGMKDRGSLTEEERHRFDFTLLSYWHVFETMHYQALVGAGESGLMSAEERSIRAALEMPGIREWWSENPYAFGPDFREYIDRLAAETAAGA